MGVTLLMVVLLAQAAPEVRSIAPRDLEALPGAGEANLPASVDVRSTMGKRFRLVEARVVMDGLELASRTANRGQELEPAFRLYEGKVRGGWHSVNVTLVYEGRNTGIFTYLDDYKFRVESTMDFTFQQGRPAAIEVLAYERPGANVAFEQKPIMEVKAAANSGATAAATGR